VTFITDTPCVAIYSARLYNQNSELFMNLNIGGLDRILRIIAGLALIGLAVSGTIGVWGWIGVVPLLTGLFKFCPAYAIFGISSCPMK
jgi:hypothetical protein